MPRYHVSKSGAPAICEATVRGCPLGESTPHGEFDSLGDARAWSETVLEQEAGGVFSKKPKRSAADKVNSLWGHLRYGDMSEFTAELEVESYAATTLKNNYETTLLAYEGKVFRSDYDGGDFRELSPDELLSTTGENEEAERWARINGVLPQNSFGSSSQQRNQSLFDLQGMPIGFITEEHIRDSIPEAKSVYFTPRDFNNSSAGQVYIYNGEHVMEISESPEDGELTQKVFAVSTLKSGSLPGVGGENFSGSPEARRWLDSLG